MRQGDLLADEAIAQAEDHADEAWLQAAKRVVWDLIKAGEPFSSDDCWARLDLLDVHTHEPRALGAVLRTAARHGWIVNSEMYVKSSRAVNHSRPVPLWLPTNKKAA